MTRLIHIVNGPNLDRLGRREPAVYGTDTLDDIEEMLRTHAARHDATLSFVQSSHEGALVDALHAADDARAHAVILNAGAYTHTSIALHDAVRAIAVPVIEVHLSNPQARETFRHASFIAPVARGSIAGFGATGYRLALDAALAL